jgi:hypothetical protein
MSILIIVIILLSSCAITTPVLIDTTEDQFARTNALNLEVIAKNTSTLVALQVATLLTGFISVFLIL